MERTIQDLASHSESFVTVGQLAAYWNVSRKYVRRLIDTHALEAARFGPRSYRVPTPAARAFEQRSVRQRSWTA